MKGSLDRVEMLYPEILRINAKFSPNVVAVSCGDSRLSWSEFYAGSCQIANGLISNGLEKGDRVALVMHNSIEMYLAIWGTIIAGGVTVPLSVMIRSESMAQMLGNARPTFLFAEESTVDLVDQALEALTIENPTLFVFGTPKGHWRSAVELRNSASSATPQTHLEPSDSMCIMYSSGTTGVPKGSEHTHAARWIYTYGGGLLMNFHRRCVALCATPLYANGTWMTMQPAAFVGGTVVLSEYFSATGFLETVQRERVTHVFLVPTQLISILSEPGLDEYDVSSLEIIVMAGAPLQHSTLREAMRLLPSVRFCEMYGLSEGWLTMAFPEDRTAGRELTVGRSIYGSEIVIVGADGQPLAAGGVGELVGRGPGLMKGYYGDVERTEASIWRDESGAPYLRSGDVGHIDEDGYVFVSGRLKDMIISGGINVFAADVEAAFIEHPAVREVAVIGVPHAKWGETPVALVILNDGYLCSVDEIRDWGNARLAKYQRVASVEFRDDFPRAQYGKVVKNELRAVYWQGFERSI